MKKYTFTQIMLLAFLLITGCKKKSMDDPHILTEEFASVHLLKDKDWKFVFNNSPNATSQWIQGNIDSKGYPGGFPAKSYQNSENEYAFISGYYPYLTGPAVISSWMITPAVLLKNGDRIEFYTRSSNQPGSIDRLQLLLNETNDSYDVGNTPVSVGAFTKILLDINTSQTADAFPSEWTLYSVTVSGLSGTIRTRLAFRYLVNGITASGIGVDALIISK
jgi:hypothetical protein